jgi:hypothetical protein
MVSMPVRGLGLCVATTALLCVAATANADPKPLSKEEQAKVDKAIEKAVAYLKSKQTKQGGWRGANASWDKTCSLGHCLLPAYALLEVGVTRDDPVIQSAVKYIHEELANCDRTYELSLGVLFLDRLGDPKDKKLIQTLALRLIAGQHPTGGWSYYCPSSEPLGAKDARVNHPGDLVGFKEPSRTYRCPLLRSDDEEKLLELLKDLDKRMAAGEKQSAAALKKHNVPQALKYLTVFRDPKRLIWREPPVGRLIHSLDYGATDNSNTQFAMLALWVAQRYGIPVLPTFDILQARFDRSQRLDGGWGYSIGDSAHSASMTCAGLFALGIQRGMKLSLTSKTLGVADDLRVLAGMAAVYQDIGTPTGQMRNPVPHSDVYFLWSLERLGMLYDLPTIGDKEWYRWGVEDLVVNQLEDGSWGGATAKNAGQQGAYGGYGNAVNTAFALLFLKRSHPMKDLTPKLAVNAKELNQGIARLLRDPKMLEKLSSGSSPKSSSGR